MTKTWKPTAAGILDIVAGIHGLIAAGVLLTLGGVFQFGGGLSDIGARLPAFLTGGIFMTLGASHLVFGILAIAGGALAIQRKRWGWVLAGGISAIFASFIWGIPAIILTALSEGEFSEPARSITAPPMQPPTLDQQALPFPRS